MNGKYKQAQARELTAQWQQTHLLQFYDELPTQAQDELLDQIISCDFARISQLYEQTRQTPAATGSEIRPLPVTDKAILTPAQRDEMQAVGLAAMRRGEYAVVTMAGGQGTRLGYDGPKGTFRLMLEREQSLFEIYLEKIVVCSRACGQSIPWYIMTSAENHQATTAYFAARDNFGYPDIHFFQQGSLPMVDMSGRIILEEKHRIKEGPDGNGSIFRAMQRSGVAGDMQNRGIRWFFIGNVDNILAQCTDPLPLGLTIQRRSLAISKSIIKRDPTEKVGVFCLRNGHPSVVEYSELPLALAEQRNGAGELIFGDAHISCTVMSTAVLELPGVLAMPYHTAVKKAAYVNEQGDKVVPAQPNAYKFEAFIFDAFASLDRLEVLRVPREEEFAPVKNAAGEDSPATAAQLYLNHYRLTR